MTKVPFIRISLSNATILSGVYLALGAAVETIRRSTSARWAEWLSQSMEAFPARLLDLAGVLDPLRDSFAHDGVTIWQVRLLLGLVTVGVIYLTGVFVGLLMWGLAVATRAAE